MEQLQGIVGELRDRALGKFIYGHKELIELMLIAYFSRGHVLIEGPPGTAKTLTSKLLARFLSKSFKRIQFTNDMLPSDIIGAQIYSPATQEFKFISGPIFSDFVVADEINRTPPRTQSALLEAMEEKQITVEGTRHSLSKDFFVVATQNPQDYEGTFPLPEVQMDRFLFKLRVDHSDPQTEEEVIRKFLDGTLPPAFEQIEPIVIDRDQIDQEIEKVQVEDSVVRYISEILQQSRKNDALLAGSSVRAGITLAKTSRVRALLEGRDFVTPDDVKMLAAPVLRHRVKLTPEARISRVSEDQIIEQMIEQIPFPGK